MKRALILILAAAIFGCREECDGDIQFSGKCWRLTFYDEFQGSVLDSSVWTSQFPWKQSDYTTEQQLYVDSAMSVQDGFLVITAKRQDTEGEVFDVNYHPVKKTYPYTSGLIHTNHSFGQMYGYMEIRCKVPFGNGMWPAFWLLPFDKYPPEIDVFEVKGGEPDRMHMAQHFLNSNGSRTQHSNTIFTSNLSLGFHTYAIEWNPKEIIWYLDDRQVWRSDVNVPQEPMWLVVNLAVGGGFPGYADESTPSPSYLVVDYVRVYQLAN